MSSLGSLNIVPLPFRDELLTSWLIRVAEEHAVTVKELLKELEIYDVPDPDVAFSAEHISRLIKGVPGDFKDAYAILGLFQFVRKKSWLKVWLRKGDESKNRVGFCPECLAEDQVPYFRGVWRFRFWTICEEHNQRILDACTFCGQPLELWAYTSKISLMLPDRDLATCRCCYKPLYFLHSPTEQNINLQFSEQQIALQRAIVSALIHGKYRLNGIPDWLPLELLPSFLLLGVVGGRQDTSYTLNPMLQWALRTAKRNLKNEGRQGFYAGVKNNVVLERLYGVWKGDAGQLAEVVIQRRFQNFVFDDVLEGT